MTERQFAAAMERLSAGDLDAWHQLYVGYASAVYAVALSVTGRAADAEDVVADVFLRIRQQSSAYRPQGRHRAWLSAIARHAALDLLRRQSRSCPVETPPETAVAHTEEATVCDRLTLEQALLALPPEQRQVVALHVISDLPFREVARLLEKPMGTVTWQYRAAMKTLCTVLDDSMRKE